MSKSSKGSKTTAPAAAAATPTAAAAAAVQVAPVKASAQVMRATAQVAKAQVKPASGSTNSKSAVAQVAPAVVSVAADSAKSAVGSSGTVPKVLATTTSKRAVLPKRRKRSEEEAKARHRAVERRRVEKINTCIMSIRDEMERLGAVMRKDKASVLNAVHSFLRQYNDKRESVGMHAASQAASGAVNPTKRRDLSGAQARQQSVGGASAGPVAAGGSSVTAGAGTAGPHSQSIVPSGFQGVQNGQQQAWQPLAGAEPSTSTQQQAVASNQGSAEKLASLSHLHTRQTRSTRATRATRSAK